MPHVLISCLFSTKNGAPPGKKAKQASKRACEPKKTTSNKRQKTEKVVTSKANKKTQKPATHVTPQKDSNMGSEDNLYVRSHKKKEDGGLQFSVAFLDDKTTAKVDTPVAIHHDSPRRLFQYVKRNPEIADDVCKKLWAHEPAPEEEKSWDREGISRISGLADMYAAQQKEKEEQEALEEAKVKHTLYYILSPQKTQPRTIM